MIVDYLNLDAMSDLELQSLATAIHRIQERRIMQNLHTMPEVNDQEFAMWFDGATLDAIVAYRRRTGVSLKAAKLKIESIRG